MNLSHRENAAWIAWEINQLVLLALVSYERESLSILETSVLCKYSRLTRLCQNYFLTKHLREKWQEKEKLEKRYKIKNFYIR